MITRITLSGELRGSAVLTERGSLTRVRLTLRGPGKGLSLIYYDGTGVGVIPLSGSEAEAPCTGICALGLSREGKLVSSGFTPACAAFRERLLDEMRIRAAQEAAPKPERSAAGSKPAAKAPGAEGETLPASAEEGAVPTERIRSAPNEKREIKDIAAKMPNAGVGRAGITEQILRRAQLLFEALGDNAGGKAKDEAQGGKEQVADGFEERENPFPKTFPGARWRAKPGEETLYGAVRLRGKRFEAAAYPFPKAGEGRSPQGGKTLIAKDGRRYLIELLPGSAPQKHGK